MLDKPRNPRQKAETGSRGAHKPSQLGLPGERPKDVNRQVGKPVKGPTGARPSSSRPSGGVDRKTLETLEKLEKEGLLSNEGKRMLAEKSGRKPSTLVGRTAQAPRGASGARLRSTGAALAKSTSRKAVGRGLNDAESAVAQRLHKVMAQAGVASRRHSEELIQAGRVKVNGKVVTELGMKVVPGRDIVEVDSRPLGKPQELVYIIMNKPKGYVTTLYDPQDRPKVVDLLQGDIAERVYPVGRLDYETEGLLLLTNDGDLANAIMHPSMQVKKTYIAKVRGVPGPGKVRALETGLELDDGVTAPAEVKLIEVKGPNAATLSIRIHEGRNRQVRRMFEAVGHEVIHLRRTTLGPLGLKELQVGQWRFLTEQEISEIKRAVGLKAPGAPKPAGRPVGRPARVASARAEHRSESGERPVRGAAGPGKRPRSFGKPTFFKNRSPK